MRSLKVSPTQRAPAIRSSRFTRGKKVGPYRLVRLLGAGGFGEVWLAEKLSRVAKTQLALKLPTRSQTNFASVQKEAQLWVRAGNHPNVLPIFEASIYGRQVVIVSEYAPEGSLHEWLCRHGGKAPSVEVGGEIMLGVLAGLEHLHVHSILHRDLKPTNILMKSGTPCLADFGISRLIAPDQVTYHAAGTPAYMAPEAFDGVCSVQTDVWAAGVIMFQLLSGRLPFQSKDGVSLVRSIMVDEPQFPARQIPEAIRNVIVSALQKDPIKRPLSATDMRSLVRDALRTLTNSAFPTKESLARTCTTIAITGSMFVNRTRAARVMRSLIAPYCSPMSTWYCGSDGDVDELAVELLLEARQRLRIVGYKKTLTAKMALLRRRYDIPRVDGYSLNDAPGERNLFPGVRADLVIVVWDGNSAGTRSLLDWLREQSKDHVVGFV